MTTNTPQDGGPAFQCEEVKERMKGLPSRWVNNKGMSLRDWFAGMALTGICSNLHCTPEITFQEVAVRAFQQADAMLAARNTNQPNK